MSFIFSKSVSIFSKLSFFNNTLNDVFSICGIKLLSIPSIIDVKIPINTSCKSAQADGILYYILLFLLSSSI